MFAKLSQKILYILYTIIRMPYLCGFCADNLYRKLPGNTVYRLLKKKSIHDLTRVIIRPAKMGVKTIDSQGFIKVYTNESYIIKHFRANV